MHDCQDTMAESRCTVARSGPWQVLSSASGLHFRLGLYFNSSYMGLSITENGYRCRINDIHST